MSAFVAIVGSTIVVAPAKFDHQAYSAGHFSLELDGIDVGPIMAIEGGRGSAEKLTADNILKKHFAKVRFQEINMRCGVGMGEQVYDWIRAQCRGASPRHAGAIVVTDSKFEPKQRLEFTGAVLSEVEFPALDARSKEPTYLTLHLSPTATRFVNLGGMGFRKPPSPSHSRWMAGHFRLAIQGLDCSTVSGIGAITVRQKVVDSSTGELRDYQPDPTHPKLSSLAVTIPDSYAAGFFDWRRQGPINGRAATSLKSGHLMYLASDRETPVFALSFHNLAIIKVALERPTTGGDLARRVKAEMVCEKIDFAYSSAATSAARAANATNRPRRHVEARAGILATGNLTHAQ